MGAAIRLVVVSVAAVALVVLVVVASGRDDGSEERFVAPVTTSMSTSTTSTTMSGDPEAEPHDQSHMGAVQDGDVLTAAERGALNAQQLIDWPQLEALRTDVPWRTKAEAIAAGYDQTPEGPAEAVDDDHLVTPGLMDETLDLAHPEMLLVDGGDPAARIVAAVYFVFGADPTGSDGILGEHEWHRHNGACRVGGELIENPVEPASWCKDQGGTLVGKAGWMLHAWVVEDFPNPDGVFAVNNYALPQPVP